MTREPETEGERERERYRNAASNLLAFGFEKTAPVEAVAQPVQHRPSLLGLLARAPTVQPEPIAVPTGVAAAPVRWHVPPEGADWSAHEADWSCVGHIDAASRGEVPFGGHIEVQDAP
jgi:hypothetical protein